LRKSMDAPELSQLETDRVLERQSNDPHKQIPMLQTKRDNEI